MHWVGVLGSVVVEVIRYARKAAGSRTDEVNKPLQFT
jgi:hypothetical protein